MQIHELPEYSGDPTTNDVFPIDTGTHTFKLPFADLGEAIITTVSATISGVSQTVKAAIEALATRVGTLEAANTWRNVKNSITLTKGTNCSAVTLSDAYQIGKILFLKIYVSPVSGIAAGANVDVKYSGFTPKIDNDFRLLPGIVGVGQYQAWLASPNIIRFRLMAGSTAWTATNVAFTAIIPLA